MLDFDIQHRYKEIEGSRILNDGWTDSYIREATQEILFSLNEKGVLLSSEARIVATRGIEKPRPRLIFDRPFLIYLKKEYSEMPYFIMWVGDSEVMQVE